jgi:hypothetical protein
MTPQLTAVFTSRDLSNPVHAPVPFYPTRLNWTAFGGPDQALLVGHVPILEEGKENPLPDSLYDSLALLRCGVTVSDHRGIPAWWGYVHEIRILLGRVQYRVTLDRLFNQVRVKYTYLTPDQWMGEALETAWASDAGSQNEYGIREKVIRINNIDHDFAEALRDAFLESHAYPITALEGAERVPRPQVQLLCYGWFHTLKWKAYTTNEGYLYNTGPGPGIYDFGKTTTIYSIGQSFRFFFSGSLKYVDVKLRKIGLPTQNIHAKIYTDVSNTPGVLLATSDNLAAASLNGSILVWTRFTFSTPVALTTSTRYWFVIDPASASAANYFQIKIDDDINAYDSWAKLGTSSGTYTNPSPATDLYFRLVCIKDTGDQIYNIASYANQFFTSIETLTTGVNTCPYRSKNQTAFEEIEALLKSGTSNHRLILADVSHKRQLTFYEQPAADTPDIFMDAAGRFWDSRGIRQPAYMPPVARWARLASPSRITHPWDKKRLPAAFIAGAEFRPLSPGAADGFTTISTL